MARHWIHKAIKRPGALHRDLGIPIGHRIPDNVLRQATRLPGKVGERARMALRLRTYVGPRKHRR